MPCTNCSHDGDLVSDVEIVQGIFEMIFIAILTSLLSLITLTLSVRRSLILKVELKKRKASQSNGQNVDVTSSQDRR
jgi:hypothetical protein